MDRLDYNFGNRWHSALNDFNSIGGEFHHWMYEAKAAADETPRLALLFKMEREKTLAKVHHQCSHDIEGEKVTDNHLTCCMGTECRKCPFLLALEKMVATPEQIDQAKAWTCVTHILSELKSKSFDTSEGFVKTTDDMMYWQDLYASLADANDGTEADADGADRSGE